MSKRRLLMILLLLVAGAIVNVAVAWGCAVWGRYATRAVDKELHGVSWPRPVDADWPLPEAYSCGGGYGVSQQWFSASGLALPEEPLDSAGRGFAGPTVAPLWMLLINQSGWPLESLEYATRFDGAVQFDGLTPPEWIAADSAHSWRRLPIKPVWPGFAINTLFYTAILWPVVAAPFALPRRRRIKRGLCPKCAYRVGSSDVCTECGAAVVNQKAETQKAETP